MSLTMFMDDGRPTEDTTPQDYTGSTDPQTALATLKGRLERGESHCSEEKELRWLIAEYESLRARILINDDRHRDLEAQLRRERDEARKRALEEAVGVICNACDAKVEVAIIDGVWKHHHGKGLHPFKCLAAPIHALATLPALPTAAQPAQEQP